MEEREDGKESNTEIDVSLLLESVGQWEINPDDVVWIKQIGQGSFGQVWEGTYDGTPVALKKLFHPSHIKYWRREIDALCSLSHPLIVQVKIVQTFLNPNAFQMLGIVLVRNTNGGISEITIVTEFVEGKDLRVKILDPGWELNWKRRFVLK